MTLGEIAYNAYCDSRDWLSVRNDKLPPYHGQTDELKHAWESAAGAVFEEVQRRSAYPPSEMEGPHEMGIIMNKRLRRDIDVNIQTVKCLPASRERSLAITRLQEAVMWLGMDLKRLNALNPYPHSKDPTNTIIDPTADGLKL